MYDQTKDQANLIVRGKMPCPICSTQPTTDCVCGFYRELFSIYQQVMPEKYRLVQVQTLRASEKSHLRIDLQAKLYDELRANWNSGWALFAPAGYSKTTCSYALYRQAIGSNLRVAWTKQPGGFGIDRPFMNLWAGYPGSSA